jgi:hypothetical protein
MFLPDPRISLRSQITEHTVLLALVHPRGVPPGPLVAALHALSRAVREGLLSLLFPRVGALPSRGTLVAATAIILDPDRDRPLPNAIELEGPAAQVEVLVVTTPTPVTMEGKVADEDITGIILLGLEHPPPRSLALVIVQVF